jgi:hypothetical protein
VRLADPLACVAALNELRSLGKLVGIRPLIAYESDPEWLLQPAVRLSRDTRYSGRHR